MHAVLNSYYHYYWSLVRIILFRLLVISVDCNTVRLQFKFLRQLYDDKLQTLIISSFVFCLQNKENKTKQKSGRISFKAAKKNSLLEKFCNEYDPKLRRMVDQKV